MKDFLTQALSHLSKNALAGLVVLFLWLWAGEKIKQNNVNQDKILDELKYNGKVVRDNKKELRDVKEYVIDGFNQQKIETDAIRQKQNVVIETLPELSKKAVKQINQIYDEMKKDQQNHNINLRDGSRIDSVVTPIFYKSLEHEMVSEIEPKIVKKNLVLLTN